MTVTEADIPSEAPAAGSSAEPPVTIASASEKTGGRISRTDEEAPRATSTPVDSRQAIAPGESASDTTLALHSMEEKPVEPSREQPALPPVTPITASEVNPLQGSIKGGRWVINLLSDPNEALAKQFVAKAHEHGITVEQNRTEVKGRVFWRVQITGFETASEARAHAEEIKAKLHLKDVWIFKDQG